MIGVPEGTVAGTDFGVRQLMGALSVESLTQLSSDGRAMPRLAERWAWEQDGLRLRVFLRKDVSFHNGTPLNAELVSSILRDAVARPGNRALYPSLSDVTAVRPDGDLQVVIDVSTRSAFLAEDLEFPLSAGGTGGGTGPYRVVKEDPSELVLTRFEDYRSGQPGIREVIIRPFKTLRTAWTSLLRGDIDMVTDVPPEAVEFIRNDSVQVISFPRRYQYLVAFNAAKRPFASKAVRRALNTAIDRDLVIKNVLKGRGTPATGPIWPEHWAYDDSVGRNQYDPGLSMSLLDAEGLLSTGAASSARARFRFVCLIPANFSLIERLALEIQRQLYAIGVDMQFQVVSIEDFNSRITEGRFEAMLISMVSGPTLERSYQFWQSPGAYKGLNVFGYDNQESERTYQQLRATTNEAAVRSATSRLQRVLLDDPPALFLAWDQRSRAVGRAFNVVQEDLDQDPLHTLWRWTENTDRQP